MNSLTRIARYEPNAAHFWRAMESDGFVRPSADPEKIEAMARTLRLWCCDPSSARVRAILYEGINISVDDAKRLDIAALRRLQEIVKEERS